MPTDPLRFLIEVDIATVEAAVKVAASNAVETYFGGWNGDGTKLLQSEIRRQLGELDLAPLVAEEVKRRTGQEIGMAVEKKLRAKARDAVKELFAKEETRDAE